MKNRIWELDAFRGICILGMVVVHFVYDIVYLYRLADWQLPEAFLFVQRWGGILFLLLSGICVTLGHRSVRRGLIVFGCGLVVSAVTWGMYRFLSFGDSIIIYFGVLHCLGVCMILWPCFRKLPLWALCAVGATLAALGFLVETITVPYPWLMPLGLKWENFYSSDYFPLLPNLGWFLLGAAIGRTAYKSKTSLLPKFRGTSLVIRFLTGCGRQSLLIYLLHQPVLSGILYVVSLML